MPQEEQEISWLRRAGRLIFWPFGRVTPRTIGARDLDDAVASLRKPHLRRVNNELVGLSRLLMDENRRICEHKLESIRSLEKKALGKITAAGTILAILAAFAQRLPFSHELVPIIMLGIAVSSYVIGLYVREGALPSPGVFLSTEIISEPWNEGRVAVLLAGAWRDYGLVVEAANESKARYVKTGDFWLIAALVTIVLLVFLSARANSSVYAGASPAPNPSIRSQIDVRRREGAAIHGHAAHGFSSAPRLGSRGRNGNAASHPKSGTP